MRPLLWKRLLLLSFLFSKFEVSFCNLVPPEERERNAITLDVTFLSFRDLLTLLPPFLSSSQFGRQFSQAFCQKERQILCSPVFSEEILFFLRENVLWKLEPFSRETNIPVWLSSPSDLISGRDLHSFLRWCPLSLSCHLSSSLFCRRRDLSDKIDDSLWCQRWKNLESLTRIYYCTLLIHDSIILWLSPSFQDCWVCNFAVPSLFEVLVFGKEVQTLSDGLTVFQMRFPLQTWQLSSENCSVTHSVTLVWARRSWDRIILSKRISLTEFLLFRRFRLEIHQKPISRWCVITKNRIILSQEERFGTRILCLPLICSFAFTAEVSFSCLKPYLMNH